MGNDYRSMSIPQLWEEWSAWDSVIKREKEPGLPSNSARETAARHMAEIEGWIARRRLEAAP